MIALRLDFLAGRFHSAPWDRAVHEDDVEWPPSPWRILRSLVAAFYLQGESDVATLGRLCDRLASLPRFLLPPTSSGHTRHYMPIDKSGKTGLVLDAFVAFADRRTRAYVVWDDVVASTEERVLLARLCRSISYIGRTESWCSMTVIDTMSQVEHGLFTVELASKNGSLGSGPVVRRLGASADLRGKGLIESLSETTAVMRKRRSTMPLGTVWCTYRFPADYGRDQLSATIATKRTEFSARALRFRLEIPSKGIGTLPSVTETLSVAEAFRRAVLSIQGARNEGQNTPLFTGKTADGAPLTGENHAYYLPRDRDGDGRIDTVDVHLPRAFSHEEYRALTSLAKISARLIYGCMEDLLVTFIGDAPVGEARVWRSTTPFVLPRFEKIRGTGDERRLVDTPADQIRRELSHRSLTLSEVVVRRGPEARISLQGGRSVFAGTYRRVRQRDGRNGPPREAIVATLTFEDDIRGPLALGQYAHFGLGQFEPVEETA